MELRSAVITVGNFDGVHLGHQALIHTARQMADERGNTDVVVLTFAQHPLTILRPDRVPLRVADTTQRMTGLLNAGTDRIEWLTAEEQLLSLSPNEFVERVVEKHRCVGWVEGPDFRFGKDRVGDVTTLKELGQTLGFETRVVEPIHITLRDKSRCPVGSSLIRWLLAQGRVSDVSLCLGRPYVVRGAVVWGEQRGRDIGFPTANLDTIGLQLPADGVYAGRAVIGEKSHLAAISVGDKPTFDGTERVFEAFLLDYEGQLYDQVIEVEVSRWLRDQAHFPTVESLVEQMNVDIATVRRLAAANLLDADMTIAV